MEYKYYYSESSAGKKYIKTRNDKCQIIWFPNIHGFPAKYDYDNPYPVHEGESLASTTKAEFDKAEIEYEKSKKTKA